MRYKDVTFPKRKKLKATAEIRAKYAAKPIICLYRDEVDAIIDYVLEHESGGFYAWIEEWQRFIFKEANFVIKPRAKGDSVYAAYKVQGSDLRVSVFAEDCDDSVEFMVDSKAISPDYLMEESVMSVFEYGETSSNSITLPTSRDFFDEFNRQVGEEKAEFASLQAKAKAKIAEATALFGGKSYEEFIEETRKKFPEGDPNRELVEKVAASVLKKAMPLYKEELGIIQQHKEFHKNALDLALINALSRLGLSILTTLYHFQVRQPKIYLEANESHTEGYKRWNKDYNPLKRLSPPAIVRPRNGTRSWFEQQRARLTESWHVKGHHRVLQSPRYKEKRGQTIWVGDFIKGSGEGMRLSIYAEDVAGKDVVDVEEEFLV